MSEKKVIDTDLVMANIAAKREEIAVILGEMKKASSEKDFDREFELEAKLFDKQDEIQDLVGDLKYSPVIQLLWELSNENISPQPALDRWIDSWC